MPSPCLPRSKGKAAEELRGAPYLLSEDEVAGRTAEAWGRGATEVCMQVGSGWVEGGGWDRGGRVLAGCRQGASQEGCSCSGRGSAACMERR